LFKVKFTRRTLDVYNYIDIYELTKTDKI